MILPSKKVLSFLIITVALVVSSITVFGKNDKSPTLSKVGSVSVGEKIDIPQNTVWQSDLGKLDTQVSTSTRAENETTTDIVSKSLLSNYLVLKQNNLVVDEEFTKKIVDQTESYISQANPKQITASELNIIADKGKETIAKYGDDLGLILKKNKPKENRSEIQILQQALAEQNPEKIEELQEAIDIYKSIALDLQTMPVPQAFTKAHLDTVNGLSNSIFGLENIKKVFKDPLIGLKGLETYQVGVNLFITAVRASSEFIKSNGVIYEQGSGGYYLLYGI